MLRRAALILLAASALVRAAEDDEIVRVAFRGNAYLSAETLGMVFGVRDGQYVSERRVERGRQSLLDLYRENGFSGIRIETRIERRYGLRGGMVVYVDIHEGPPTLVESLEVHHAGLVDQGEIDAAVGSRPGDVWTLAYSDAVRLSLIRLYAEHGYLYANVKVEEEREESRARLTATVDEGPRVKVVGVDLEGYEPVIERVIRREIVIREGDYFKASDVFASQRNIYSTGLFTNVTYTIVGESERSPEVRIRFDLEPDKTNWVGFELGYTYSESTGSGLRFEVSWGDDNLWGNLQHLEVGANFVYAFKTSRFEEELYQAVYREPWLLSVRGLSGRVRVYYERERRTGFSADSFGGEASLEQRFYDWLTGALGLRYERVNLYSYDIPDLPQEEGYSNTSALFARVGIDTRDNPFNPRSGVYLLPYAEYAGGPLGGDNDFYKLTADLSGHIPLGDYVSLALRGYVALADVHHDTRSLPVYERFYTGGAYSVRGFPERSLGPRNARGVSLGGVASLVGNAELRVDIPDSDFSLGFFADTGMVWDDISEMDPSDLAVGVGAGVRYVTPIGPVRLDVGFVVAPGTGAVISPYAPEDYTDTSDNWELHLAIGHIF
jgi:outer membrane protein insertion porin family